MPAKVIHGHSIEIELGPSCPNPGIRRELEAQGKPYMCTSDIATWIGVDNKFLWTSAIDDVFKDCFIPTTTHEEGPLQFEIDEQLNTTWYKK